MVPMRAIFEVFGMVVFWHSAEEAIADELEEMIRENETYEIPNAEIFDWVAYRPVIQAFGRYGGVLLQIGSNAMLVMGIDILDDRWVELDVPPQIVDNRTLVPVRAISEGLNADVEWCDDTRTVTITTPIPRVVQFENALRNQLPDDWEIVRSAGLLLPFATRTYNFDIIPPDANESYGIITIGNTVDGQPLTVEDFSLWQSVLEESILPRAVEETAAYTHLTLNNGFGIFSGIYTDADLVGTIPPPEEYMYLGIFLGNWDNGTIAHATLFTNDTESLSFNLMKLALTFMEVSFE